MSLSQKEILFTTKKPYCTLNTLSSKTKNIWFVCHGMGYLSRYFLNYFKGLNTTENYIIAPQAPSLYYQPGFKHVGASWLTKENTIAETENIMNYFDSIFSEENISTSQNLIVFGYSQGVSIAMRYIAKRKLQCKQLILHSGGIPKELTHKDFNFLGTKTTLIYGTKDEYLDESRIIYETKRAEELFNKNLTIIPFEGKHEVNTTIIKNLVS